MVTVTIQSKLFPIKTSLSAQRGQLRDTHLRGWSDPKARALTSLSGSLCNTNNGSW